ncbi:MAG: ArsB/NhaD family transporter [Acutalibacteraceae bacterium]|nr:ArsB/NhaD family transporter [Acutalibacteraceae bacterium]
MNISLIVCVIVAISVFLSVITKPYVYIKGIKVGTYWLFSALGAIILLVSGSIPLKYLFTELTSASSINPIKILILFFAMTSLSVFLDEIGFFRYLANLALRKNLKKQLGLFIALYTIVSMLTIFTSNDIVVLTFTPFICFFAKNAKINPLPYLFAEFVASNTWSMLLIIGNPTNIYLASSAGIDFITYVKNMILPTCLAGITSFVILLFIFHKELKKPICATVTQTHIEQKTSLTLGVIHLAICTILLAISSYFSLEMYLVSAIFACSLYLSVFIINLIRRKSLKPIFSSFKRLPYELIPFVLSMFVLVLSLKYSGTTETLSNLISKDNPIYTIGTASFLVSNIINNIPMSVLFSSLLSFGTEGQTYYQSVYSAIIGSNIGAFFTPVGALAGIMWASILKRFDIDFSFKKFILYGMVISIPTLFSALFGLSIIF